MPLRLCLCWTSSLNYIHWCRTTITVLGLMETEKCSWVPSAYWWDCTPKCQRNSPSICIYSISGEVKTYLNVSVHMDWRNLPDFYTLYYTRTPTSKLTENSRLSIFENCFLCIHYHGCKWEKDWFPKENSKEQLTNSIWKQKTLGITLDEGFMNVGYIEL